MRDKKLTIVIPAKLLSRKEFLGFKLYSLSTDQQDLPISCYPPSFFLFKLSPLKKHPLSS